jgi:heme/copper-type cytochrome/quinol oxidase subunit 4
LSQIPLAEAIDRLVDSHQALVTESEDAVVVSALSAEGVSELNALCESLGWPQELFDKVGERWDSSESPDPDFAPFRLVIQKPAAAVDTLQLLSNHAFAQWLESGHAAPCWRIARLGGCLVTGVRVIQSWEGTGEAVTLAATKSPRALVKEFGNARCVPEDVRHWLASALEAEHFANQATQVWVRAASAALVSCLPDEIGEDNEALKFRGPPRLTLQRLDGQSETLDCATFNTLLKAVSWVFENEREAEVRHILLAAELARSGSPIESTAAFLRQHLEHAWESAQIAYQMALSDTGRDTLKVLSDLRKAVTEETAKLSEMSRQLTGSVAAAVITGIALIAVRIAASAPAALIVVVMLVVALYVAMVISSGIQFMRLQRQLRADWQHRLYRFLPEAEYTRMVVIPTSKAERSFTCTAWLGGAAVAVLTAFCGWTVLPVPVAQAVTHALGPVATFIGTGNSTSTVDPPVPDDSPLPVTPIASPKVPAATAKVIATQEPAEDIDTASPAEPSSH